MDEEYNYWEVSFRSCEGNDRWTIARTPMDWSECDVRDSIQMGGCGDDPADIKEIMETSDEDWGWDLTNN